MCRSRDCSLLSQVSCYEHYNVTVYSWAFLISSFRRVLYVVCFVLGNYPASGFYMPTFWNTLSVPSS